MPVKPGFSAIELLLVAGIISLLVAVAVPNFLDAKIRAEVAEVKEKLRITSKAIEVFKIDHNRLPDKDPMVYSSEPAFRELVNAENPYLQTVPVDRFKIGLRSEMLGPLYDDEYLHFDNLNSPVSQNVYAKVMRRNRFDPFSPTGKGNQWVLKSIGPDQTDFQDEGLGRGTYQKNINGFTEYNPSNGIFSLGEIVHTYVAD